MQAESHRSDVRPLGARIYELVFLGPVLAAIAFEASRRPGQFAQPILLMWVLAISATDLLPVPTSVEPVFSLSFPLELAVAMLYPPGVAAAVALLGSSDVREWQGELSPMHVLFNRAQIGLATMGESLTFHSMAEIAAADGKIMVSAWYVLVPAVVLATVVGYAINVSAVAGYHQLRTGRPAWRILREMHAGIFGEFLGSYMILALFSTLVATTFVRIGPWSLAVFATPLAFAWQMFRRTYSLKQMTEELAERQREIEYQALHDSLTGLPNRALFLQTLQEALGHAQRTGEMFAVIIVDLDRFKEVNDALGHHYGDALLEEIGPRLTRALRDGDLIARLGGDEFGIVLPGLPDGRVAMRIAGRLFEELEKPLQVEGLLLEVSASMGIAVYPTHSDDVETLLRRADMAMYAAKDAGNGVCEVYEPAFDRYSPSRMTLIGQVRPGIENQEFKLDYQPKVWLNDGCVAGVEGLVRWNHPERGLVMPDDFIPLVEQTGLLRPLTAYVLVEALRQWRDWKVAGIDIQVAVNLSVRNLLDLQLPDQVADALSRFGAPSSALAFELTESFLMANPARSVRVLEQLSEVGVDLSIDDFGTGYSSLSYLRRLPIDEIKIDRSFVMRMTQDAGDATIVHTTVDLAKNLGLRVVAEGVEDEATWDRLRALGCDVAQGYFVARPMPSVQASRWLERRASGHTGDLPDRRGSDDRRFGHGFLKEQAGA